MMFVRRWYLNSSSAYLAGIIGMFASAAKFSVTCTLITYQPLRGHRDSISSHLDPQSPSLFPNALSKLEHADLQSQHKANPTLSITSSLLTTPNIATALLLTHSSEELLHPFDGSRLRYHHIVHEPNAISLCHTLASDTPKHVRVLRSHRLQSPLAPKAGVRYDGLFSVKGYGLKLTPPNEWTYSFELERVVCEFCNPRVIPRISCSPGKLTSLPPSRWKTNHPFLQFFPSLHQTNWTIGETICDSWLTTTDLRPPGRTSQICLLRH